MFDVDMVMLAELQSAVSTQSFSQRRLLWPKVARTAWPSVTSKIYSHISIMLPWLCQGLKYIIDSRSGKALARGIQRCSAGEGAAPRHSCGRYGTQARC